MSGWLDPLRGMSPEAVQQVDEVCLMHSVHPCAAALLLEFRDTPDGKKFMDGQDLTPQFGPPKQTQSWARMSLDWLDE